MGVSQAPAAEDSYAVKRHRVSGPFSAIWHKLIAYWVLSRFPFRFYFALLGALFVMVFARVAYNAPLYSVSTVVVAFVVISLINAGGCAINDYFDREADAVSKPHRPIPAGDISPRGALAYTAVTFVTGAFLTLSISFLAFFIVAVEMVFLVTYPGVLKHLSGLAANFLMGVSTGLIAIFSEALLLGQISYLSLAFVPIYIAGGMQCNAFTDIVTTEGDAKVGYTTVAVTRGVRAAITVVVATSLLGVVFVYLPYLLGIVGIAYAIVVTAAAFARLYVAYSLIRKPTVENVKGMMWAAALMVSDPVALLAGAFLSIIR
ncbi:MAG: UbiA family prenyltransferase [Halobacteriota archaeon]